MWDDERIDGAIDETARQMTAGEPGADFRARVLARLATGPRARAIWRPLYAGAGVAALILIALVVSRDRKSPQRPPQSAPAPVVRLKPDPTYENTVRLPPSPLRGYDGPRKPDPTYSVVAQGFSPAIAALKGCATTDCDGDALELPALDLDSIAVAALAASDSIDIEPLPLASPIAVTPLDVEDEGDRR